MIFLCFTYGYFKAHPNNFFNTEFQTLVTPEFKRVKLDTSVYGNTFLQKQLEKFAEIYLLSIYLRISCEQKLQ